MICPSCGAEIPENTSVCPYCGNENEKKAEEMQEIEVKSIYEKIAALFKLPQQAVKRISRILKYVVLILIGIFAIAIPVIGLFVSFIARLVIGSEATEISIDMSGIFMGIIVLCLTQFFAHGVELENDVDGLL